MRFVACCLTLLVLAAPTLAQTKKPAPPKPMVKPPAAGQPYVLGTKQLPGEFGKLGQEYTIGVNDPINVTVKSASYLVDRLFVETIGGGKETWFPPAGKKYLRVDMTLKNGNPKQVETGVFLRLTAVDANDENHEWQAVYNVKTGKEVTQTLKPAQSLDVFTLFEVTSEVEIPKLMVAREDGAAILRYDLRGKTSPLPAWAGSGGTATDTFTGVRDAYHPLRHFDVGVRGLEWTKANLDGDEAGEEERFLVAHLTFRAATGGEPLNFGTVLSTVKTEDDLEVVRDAPGGVGGFLLENKNESYSGSPQKGEVVNARVYFRMKEGIQPKTLILKDDQATGRTIRFDLMGADWFMIRDCVRDFRGTGTPAK